MKILVIGGSKGLGRQTVKAALEKGHEVTVFARNPSILDITHPRLQLQAGDVLDISSLEHTMLGTDIVTCTLGLRTRQAIGPPFSKASYVLSVGTKNILTAMTHTHVKRLICVTAIGTGDSLGQCAFWTRLTLRYGLRWLFKQKDAQEQVIKKAAGIDWTVIRPTALTNGSKRGVAASNDVRCGLLTHVSRADVADYIIGIINQKSTYKKALILSYQPRFGDSVRWLCNYFGDS